ncbi:MAG TPA: flagellar hook-length control protein FliK [Acidimicrobiales bacterium]|nr:flagellar hook-length control protein FliK [Acidimicrobiales bacterium]
MPSQVIQQLIERPPRPNTTVVLRLDPPLLGSVVLRVIAGDGNRIRLHFGVDDPRVGDALTAGLGRLESALRAQGLSPQGLSVGLNNTQLGGGPPGQSGQDAPPTFGGRPAGGGSGAIEVAPTAGEPASLVRANGGRYIDYLL